VGGSQDGEGSPAPGTVEGMTAVGAVVTVGGRRHELEPGNVFTFGRDDGCDECLDPDDVGISRLAGSIEHESGTWWVTNRSEKRPAAVVDALGIRAVLAPGRRAAVDGSLTVVVEGTMRRHALHVEVAAATEPPPVPGLEGRAGGVETAVGLEVVYSEPDRQALAALFAGYLLPFPRYDPHPRSYADAAAALDWPRTTLVKRIEYLRTRLTKAGVPNLLGDNALEHLAEHVLTTGVITRADLTLLP
jgi:hypothetical protein